MLGTLLRCFLFLILHTPLHPITRLQRFAFSNTVLSEGFYCIDKIIFLLLFSLMQLYLEHNIFVNRSTNPLTESS